MNDEITMDSIMKMLWEVTGFKGDATQTDAIRVALEALAAKLATSYGSAPSELIEAHLHSLNTLARQLLDTGGRMRLDPSGTLDEPDNPIATRQDLKILSDGVAAWGNSTSRAIAGLQADTSIQRDILLANVQELLAAKADKADLNSLRATKPDLSMVYARLDTLQGQVQTLTRTVLAAQGGGSAEITAITGDVASLCEDVALIRSQLGRMPDAYIPLHALRPEDVASQMLSATYGFTADELDALPKWRADLLSRVPAPTPDEMTEPEQPHFRQAAVDDSLRILKEIQEQDARLREPARQARPKKQAKTRPGCFFNEDGTITCRLCGEPKLPEAYYTDKQAWTGRKSACKSCERG